MRKNRISILILGFITMMTIAGCGTNNTKSSQTKNDEIYEVYKLYQANGGELTYEQWLASIKGDKGDKGDTGEPGQDGEDGISIVSVTKTSSEGLTDTYTILLSNGNSSTFEITNGACGASFIKGTEDPLNSIGSNGDTYLNVSTGVFFNKVDGEWVKDTSISNKVTLTLINNVDSEKKTFTYERGDQAYNNDEFCTLYGDYKVSLDKIGYDISNFNVDGTSCNYDLSYLPFVSMTKDRTVCINYSVIEAKVTLAFYEDHIQVNKDELEEKGFEKISNGKYSKSQTYFDEKIILPEISTEYGDDDSSFTGWILNNKPITEYSFDGVSSRDVTISSLYAKIYPIDDKNNVLKDGTYHVGAEINVVGGYGVITSNSLYLQPHLSSYGYTVTSSDEAVAKYENGKLTCLSEGVSKITVSNSTLGISSSFTISVFDTIESFSLTYSEITIGCDGQCNMGYTIKPDVAKNAKITWSSSNTSAATVSSTGLIEAVAAGTATITATVADAPENKATVNVTVLKWKQDILYDFDCYLNGYYPKYPVLGTLVTETTYTDDYGRHVIEIVGANQQTFITNYSSNLKSDGFSLVSSSTNYAYLEKEVTINNKTFTVGAYIGEIGTKVFQKYGVRFFITSFNDLNKALLCLKDGIKSDSGLDVSFPNISGLNILSVEEIKIDSSLNCGALKIHFKDTVDDLSSYLTNNNWSQLSSSENIATYKYLSNDCVISVATDEANKTVTITYK